MPPTAWVCHRTAGRLRIRVAARRGDLGYFDKISHMLAEAPGVTDVHANAVTGTVLLLHGSDIGRIGEFGAAHGLFRLVERMDSLRMQVRRGLAALNDDVGRASGGSWSLGDAAFVGLLGFAALEAIRGNLAAPAATLGWYALAVLSAPDTLSRIGPEVPEQA